MERIRKEQEVVLMERVQKVMEHPLFQNCLRKNEEAEQDRIFCRHHMQHFLDVARLSYIFSLERGYQIPKDVIYATALLHDIGKWQQYQEGIPHEVASADLAEKILLETGYEQEKEEICRAILKHRGSSEQKRTGLEEILFDADKISRSCYMCKAEQECNWSEQKKNQTITW